MKAIAAKTREQMRKIDWPIMTALLMVFIVAAVTLVISVREQSLAVFGLGCFFAGFGLWYFYQY